MSKQRPSFSNTQLLAGAVVALMSYSAHAAVDTWTGAIDGNWDTTTANWSNGGTNQYSDTDDAVFGGGSNPAITIQAAGVSPQSTTFQSTSTNYSFTNAGATGITSAGGLTLANTYTGTVTLNSANDYTGATAINGGTLALASSAAMSTGSAVTVGNGGTLSLRADANTTFTPASLTMNAGINNFLVNSLNSPAGDGKTLKIANNLGLGGNATINVTSTTGDTLEFGSTFSPGGSGSAFGGPVAAFNLTNANVILNGMYASDGQISVGSASGNSLTINGNVGNPSARTIGATVNSGVLTLNDTFSGTTSGANWGVFAKMNGGTLNLNTPGAVRSNYAAAGHGDNGTLFLTSGTLNNTSGSALTLNSNIGTIEFSGDFSFGTAASTSANNLNLGTNAVSLYSAAGTSRTVTVNGSTTLTVGGVISNGATANSIIKAGTGNLALNGANTYTGTTTVANGTLSLGGSGAISSALVLGVSGATTGILDVTAKSSFSQGNLSGNGTINIGSGKTVTITGALAPGFGAGEIDMTGDMALGTTTAMELAGIGGAQGSDFDYLNISGVLAYAGALSVSNYGGFDMAAQMGSYDLFDFASQSGDFASVIVNGVTLTPSSGTWSATSGATSYNFDPADGVLTVATPEPGSLILFLAPLAMGLLKRRRITTRM